MSDIKFVDQTEWIYVGTTLYNQRVGTTRDAGIIKVNYTLGHEDDYVLGFNNEIELHGMDVDDFGNMYFGVNDISTTGVIVGKIG